MAIIPLTVKIDMNRAARQLLIDSGTHFWCESCFFTLPIKYQGPDKKHCVDCYQVINEKRDHVQEVLI